MGFEIPADKMPQRRDFANEQELRSTPFFANNDYGMTSKAWFDAIFQLANTDNVSVFFFDWNEQQKIDSERDSSMFLNIKQEYLKDTTCIILTISGNIHNQIRPYENSKTMGYFVTTYLNNSVLSVNHIYESGTMYNNNGSGAGLRRVDKEHKTIKSISRMPNFFYFDLQHEFSKQWNAFLFTTKINASYPVKNK